MRTMSMMLMIMIPTPTPYRNRPTGREDVPMLSFYLGLVFGVIVGWIVFALMTAAAAAEKGMEDDENRGSGKSGKGVGR